MTRARLYAETAVLLGAIAVLIVAAATTVVHVVREGAQLLFEVLW